MKFTCTAVIDRPIAKVVEVFKNPGNLKKWQPGLMSVEPISGTPGTVGAKTKLVFQNKKQQDVVLTETIQISNLPAELSALYEHVHMVNTMTHRFTSLGPNFTKWEADVHYTKFNLLLPKIIGFIMPGMFQKQTQKWLDSFKAFAEKEIPA